MQNQNSLKIEIIKTSKTSNIGMVLQDTLKILTLLKAQTRTTTLRLFLIILRKNLIIYCWRGDTISAINKSKMTLSFTHLSTAGGAFLEYLEGKDLPGITVLK